MAKAQPENKMLAALLHVFKEQFPISLGHPNELDIIEVKKYFKNLFSAVQ